MRRIRLAASAVIAAALGVVAVQAAPTDPRYVRGKREWVAQRYRAAADLLFAYRAAQAGRSSQTDYMIGTGGCRMAKREVTVAEHVAATAGVACRKDESVIDESPRAYKPTEAVMAAQSDLVEIVYTLKQVVCVKG